MCEVKDSQLTIKMLPLCMPLCCFLPFHLTFQNHASRLLLVFFDVDVSLSFYKCNRLKWKWNETNVLPRCLVQTGITLVKNLRKKCGYRFARSSSRFEQILQYLLQLSDGRFQKECKRCQSCSHLQTDCCILKT